MSNTNNVTDFPYLEEDDINLLHTIIVEAEADDIVASHPIRAVFAAYYRVLATHDIDPDNDDLYLRFLLRMREGVTKSDTLTASFTGLLAQLGIQVIIDDVEDTASLQEAAQFFQHDPAQDRDDQAWTPSKRRDSFTNLEDTIQSRRSSDPGSRHIERAVSGPRSRSSDARGPQTKAPLQSVHNLPRRSALKKQPDREAVSTAGTREPSRKTAVQIREDPSLLEFDQSSESSVNSGNDSRVFDLRPPPINADAQASRRDADAKRLYFHFRAARACELFWRWRQRSKTLREQRRALTSTADAQDKKTLLKQAFEEWHAAFGNKRSDKETALFFEDLEERAGKARDVFLLTKAFTHWAQCTADEISQISAARRHILRTKCFNAWRDSTVVNELKVRHQGLGKFLQLWRRRSDHVGQLLSEASFFRNEHLTVNSYRNWFWTFCDRTAPSYYSNRLRSKALEKWTQAARQLTRREAWTDDFARFELSRRMLNRCQQRLSEIRALDGLATTFRRRSMIITSFQAMQRQLDMRPPLEALQQSTDTQRIRSALTQWYTKMRLERGAKEVNELRIMRNAFSAWNESTRCQFLRQTINDRVTAQALYQWAVAERVKIAQRVRRANIQQAILEKWRAKTDDLCGRLGRAEHQFQVWNDGCRKQSIMSRWAAKARGVKSDEDAATGFRAKKLSRIVAGCMVDEHERLVELEQVCRDARFGALTKRALETWHEASVKTRKSRRREAYSRFRREQKMNLARGILHSWQQQTQAIQALHEKATQLDHNHILTLLRALLLGWSNRSDTLTSALQLAENTSTRALTTRTLTQLHTTLQNLTASTDRAHSAHETHLESTASTALQKLALRTFQLRRQHDTAAQQAERTYRKHRRLMLRHWAERAALHRAADFSQTVSVPGDLHDDDELLVPASAPPRAPPVHAAVASLRGDAGQATPGYLKTPSRRGAFGARAQAQGQGGVSATPTPATTQITPFWSRLHDAYPSRLPRSARADVRGGV